MIKFAVLDLKNLCMKLFLIIIILGLIITIIQKQNINILQKCIDTNFNAYKKQNMIIHNFNIMSILKKELLFYNDNILVLNNKIDDEKNKIPELINDKENNLSIENIDNNKYNIEYGKIDFDIKNNTSYDLNVDELIKQDLEIFKDKSKSKILIVHTHGSESYTGIEHTDYYRTEDLTKNMIRVGDELENVLKNSGYNVLHDRNIYDYPTYTGSYSRSLESIEKYMLENSDIDIVLDLHRDAISSNSNYAPCVNINENEASKMMIIVGTDQNGVQMNEHWRENLKFGLKLQYAGEKMYPGIFRQMSVTNSRYNQHTTKGSLLIEVGATGNTLIQSINSMHYLAKILDEVL